VTVVIFGPDIDELTPLTPFPPPEVLPAPPDPTVIV
jgi:hypothetical protein